MASAVTVLVNLFNGTGTFIFAEHQDTGPPLFHIIPVEDVVSSPAPPGRHRAMASVLAVSDNACGHPDLLSDAICLLAYHSATRIVRTESMKLAKYLVIEARLAYRCRCLLGAG
ncbi:hypothetical protein BD769DRAFT_1671993 [Suillus cothurnatus]|nr:hypothetical protein BD769DRAFT_1671993 [Suillus cothurnatus]